MSGELHQLGRCRRLIRIVFPSRLAGDGTPLVDDRVVEVGDLGALLGIDVGDLLVIRDDQKVADVYAEKGAKVADLDDAIVDKWRAIARETTWKDYTG